MGGSVTEAADLANYRAPLPGYVEKEFRGLLRCGLLRHGFVRVVWRAAIRLGGAASDLS